MTEEAPIIFSKTTRYILLILFQLCQKDPEKYHKIGRLAEQTGISESYLRKIVKSLSETPYVQTKKGLKGGVTIPAHSRKSQLKSLLEDLDEFGLKSIADEPSTRMYQRERRFSELCTKAFIHRVLGSLTIREASELGHKLLKPADKNNPESESVRTELSVVDLPLSNSVD